MNEVDLRMVRQRLTDCVANGTFDNRIIDTLICGEQFIPKECELWDYKREAGTDAISMGNSIIQIVSFYNTYGGYLVYGVEETEPGKVFSPVGIKDNRLNHTQLKDKLTAYTGRKIDFSYREVTYQIGEREFVFGVLHIPKRPRDQQPIDFGKNGPEVEKGKLLFRQKEVYFRSQDECVAAKSKEDWQMLLGERNNEFLWSTDSTTYFCSSDKMVVNHNLPDKNFICPKFFGRERILSDLWGWLADEFVGSIVLAGDGGKGKTSIAYEFAQEICRIRPFDIEKVIWLTAKEKQFVASLDRFVNVPETHFYDTESLLRAICSELAITDIEVDGASISMLKKYLRNAISNFPCFIIIDNVDSCDVDQQRMILETALQISNPRGRILLTTRQNLSYSSASCIAVGGLEETEYREYVNDLAEHMGGMKLSDRQISTLWKVTNGSPLFTESLLRLCRTGMPFNEAMGQWKGRLGDEARKAALQREIEQLSVDSRRVLLACAFMQEASLTELKQVTTYDDMRIHSCINELQSLFLVSVRPFIKREQRFAVSSNTASLVIANQQMLVPDPKVLERMVNDLRKGGTKDRSGVPSRRVGAAITQANSLMLAGEIDLAVDTMDSALKEMKENPDLVLMRARCLLEKYKSTGNQESQYLNMARRGFAKAESLGQRREMLYRLWYEGEVMAKDFSGAIEVANIAIQKDIPIKAEWLRRRAEAHLRMSDSLKSVHNWNSAVSEMSSSSRDIGDAIKVSDSRQTQALLELLYQVDDRLWDLTTYVKVGIDGLEENFEVAKQSIRRGNHRYIAYEHLLETANSIYAHFVRRKPLTKSGISILSRIIREGDNLMRGVDPRIKEEWMIIRDKSQRLLDDTA